MTENGLSTSSHVPGHVRNLLSLLFSMSLYLAYKGGWLNITCGSPGVWSGVQNSGFNLSILSLRYSSLPGNVKLRRPTSSKFLFCR
jgi:hypothetical protein